MGFGGAGRAAAAISARSAAEKDDDVAVFGAFTSDVLFGSRTDDRTDLHVLCHVAVVVELIDLTRSQTDLVTVGGVACRRSGHDLTLGKLAGDGFGNGNEGICAAGDTHGRVNVGTAGERIADRAADAGSRAAEGLDFRRMVVGLVLEKEEPGLFFAVDLDLDLDGAGVDLLGFVKLIQLARLLERLACERTDVHQIDGLGSAERLAGGDVFVVSLREKLVLEGYAVNGGIEGGVTAVVGPIGVDHLDLGDRGVSAFGFEIILAERDVALVHGKTHIADHSRKTVAVKVDEAVQGCNLGGDLVNGLQGCGKLHGCLAAFHGVDHVFFDTRDLLFGKIAVEAVDLRGADGGTLALGNDLDALCRGVCSLVKLTGEVFNGENESAVIVKRIGYDIELRLGENGRFAGFEESRFDVFYVVTVQNADIFKRSDAEQTADIGKRRSCFAGKLCLLLNVNSVNHGHTFLS